MKETRITMGMPATIEIVDAGATQESLDMVFDFFNSVDERFSPYKTDSELSRYNRGEIAEGDLSEQMKYIFVLAEKTKNDTNGYFDMRHNGTCDPSGIVKGWAIHEGANLLRAKGFQNFYVEIAGDIEVSGHNTDGAPWSIGIRNPFKREEIVKVVHLSSGGIATSGTAIRGDHIYNPKGDARPNDIASITVIGPNVYEADRFATPAFAMGGDGIQFIEALPNSEGYMIDTKGIATMTSGFTKFTRALTF
ncbi:MAG: FAD:protein FMN transferase [bacterium]